MPKNLNGLRRYMMRRFRTKKSPSKREKRETETVINFNDEDSEAWIGTRQRKVKSQMRKLGVRPCRKQADYKCYQVPTKWIKISPLR